MSIKAIWADNTPYSKFMISVGIILLSAVFFTLISSLLAVAIYGISMEDLASIINNISDPRTMSILKLVQVISSIGTFILPPFFLAYLFDERPFAFLSLKKRIHFLPMLWVSTAVISIVPLINFLGELNAQMHLPGFLKGVETWMRESEDRATVVTKAFLEMPTMASMFFNLFMIALIPALGEELIFRGLVQRLFLSWTKNIHISVWTSALLFSAMHMQFYGFVPRMLLGGMLGYLLAWSGSLWLPILAHFVNNAVAVIFTYLLQKQSIQFDPDKIGTGNEMIMPVLFSAVLTAALLFLTHYYYKRKKLLGEVRESASSDEAML